METRPYNQLHPNPKLTLSTQGCSCLYYNSVRA